MSKYNFVIGVTVLLLFISMGAMWEVDNGKLNSELQKVNEIVDTMVVERSKLVGVLSYIANTYDLMKEAMYPNPIHVDDYVRPSSPFGDRNNPLRKYAGGLDMKYHYGTDFIGDFEQSGTYRGLFRARAVALCKSKVKIHYPPEGWHNGIYYSGHDVFDGFVILEHLDGTGLESEWGHFSETYVHEGQIIPAGYVLGRLGDGGISTGPHLHFGIKKDGIYLQPLRYVRY